MAKMNSWGVHDEDFGQIVKSVKPFLKLGAPILLLLWLCLVSTLSDQMSRGW